MEFKNPQNGYIETKTLPWLWTLLFGGFYFAISGLWTPLLIWLVVVIGAFAAIGPGAMSIAILINIGLAVAASSMVRAAYLRKGWVECASTPAVAFDAFAERPAASVPAVAEPAMRVCPFCAESVKAAAVLCRYCGKDLPALPAAETAPAVPGKGPAWSGKLNRAETLAVYGIEFDGEFFIYNGISYASAETAINYARAQHPEL